MKYYTEEDLKLAFDAGHTSGGNEYHNSDYVTSHDDYEETLTVDEWLAKKEVEGKELYTREQVTEIIKESLAEGFSYSTDSYNTEIDGDLDHFTKCINNNKFSSFINKILKL